MKLSELAEFESEYLLRGYRVAFERNIAAAEEPDWILDELTQDDGRGFQSPEDAAAQVVRVVRVLGERVRNVRVVDQEGRTVEAGAGELSRGSDAGSSGERNAAGGLVNEEASPSPAPQEQPPAEEVSLPVREGEPAEEQRLSLLAGSLMEEWCLVGAEDGGIYAVETATLKGWATTRKIKWKPRKPTGAVLVGTEEVQLYPVVHKETGLRAYVGFHAASGSWWSAPQPRAE